MKKGASWTYDTPSSTAHQAGIHRTSTGQQVPIRRAMSAQKSGLVWGNGINN